MTRFRLIIQSFIYYFKANLLVALGVAISTAVLTGALITGDSVRYSLEQTTFSRLGNTTHLVSAPDRYFRIALAADLAKESGANVSPVLLLEGMAIADGGQERVNKIQVTGVDSTFERIAETPLFSGLKDNEVIISRNLAERLKLNKGDEFLVRIKKASLIPMNAPFVSDAETSVAYRVLIKAIAEREQLGFFNLKNSQTAPYNLFLSLDRLNRLMKFSGKANNLLISAPSLSLSGLDQFLTKVFSPEDAGLIIKNIPLTGEKEIISERVFLDEAAAAVFKKLPGAYPVLTYFVNGISSGSKTTPYSFVSASAEEGLKNDELIINNWTSADLNNAAGDSVTLIYWEIGPLRQLTEKRNRFIIRKVVPIEGKYADKELMPYLPGLSDAGHCRDWETGVPINLDAIRDKDEAYWNLYRGTPKAFVSMDKARQMWSNRFGNYTALRIKEDTFSETKYRELFAAGVHPRDLGFILTPVREDGLKAARNGVDFSQLFLSLSFFLLASAVILIGLLFLLNLENRRSQTGTLMMLGFTQRQITTLLLAEGAIVALAGSLAGLLTAVLYTRMIFKALNTLWWEAVRTSLLEIRLNTSTLFAGLLISITVSLLTIFITMRRNFSIRAIELQRRQDKPERQWVRKLKSAMLVLCLVSSVSIAAGQFFFPGSAGSSLFFLSGGLLLTGLLLAEERRMLAKLRKTETDLTLAGFSVKNSTRNAGRSLTIIILFALGTFLVMATGANRQTIKNGPGEKNSGTGGFYYFAETTVPVLYDLNDPQRRINEGIRENFRAVQFSKIEGDDASCLNLNRTTNPAVLGVDPQQLAGRFSFSAKLNGIKDDPWKFLDNRFLSQSSNQPDSSAHQHISTSPHQHINVIPAIADQTVIKWGLGKETGDTLFYRSESGDTLGLKLIAGLAPSVFQGYVIIPVRYFLKYWPTSSGSNIFLIDGEPGKADKAGDELKEVFRDYGWEMTTTGKRLAEFNAVTNTYLSIFLVLGALGLILGTAGLAVVLARSILERKNELALLRALGFTRKQTWLLLAREYFSLLLRGLGTGFLAAVLAVWPIISQSGTGVSFGSVALIAALILVNGATWIVVLSWYNLKSRTLLTDLRNQ